MDINFNSKSVWNIVKTKKLLQVYLAARLLEIATLIQNAVKKNIGIPNPPPFKNPSKSKGYPKARTRELHNSIKTALKVVPGVRVSSFVGVDIASKANVYAALLEFDALRDGTGRPFLRRTVDEHKIAILNIARS